MLASVLCVPAFAADAAVAPAAGVVLRISALKKNGDTSDIYYLVVKMKANAGNKFQGRSFSGIGVTVFAVQGNTDITDFKE